MKSSTIILVLHYVFIDSIFMFKAKARPISPHLSIYKLQLTSAISILHRFTGISLFAGFLFIIWWMIYCIHSYGSSSSGALCMTSIALDLENDFLFSIFKTKVGKIILIAWSYTLFYHLFVGIRYMFLDAGIGFKMRDAYLSGWAVIIISAVVWASLWSFLLFFNS